MFIGLKKFLILFSLSVLVVACASGSQGAGPTTTDSVSAEHYNMTVEELNLSARTLNCLKRTGLDKVGDVLQYPEDELLKIRNFGKKSLDELHAKFDSLGITKNEDVDDDENAIVEDKEEISEA